MCVEVSGAEGRSLYKPSLAAGTSVLSEREPGEQRSFTLHHTTHVTSKVGGAGGVAAPGRAGLQPPSWPGARGLRAKPTNQVKVRNGNFLVKMRIFVVITICGNYG